MPRRIVTVSYTGLDAGGGVPKFNRDLHEAFPDRETQHFSWWDFPWHPEADERGETEWGRARLLNEYLVRARKVTSDDVVIADGFWAAGLEHLPLAVSHSHGIWSHLTKEDVDAGKPPDMPYHHLAQVEFRRRWTGMGKHLTAVSDFIAEQMRLQWGFRVDRVINNGVDVKEFFSERRDPQLRADLLRRFNCDFIAIHGVNDPGNANKWKDENGRELVELVDADHILKGDGSFNKHPFFVENRCMLICLDHLIEFQKIHRPERLRSEMVRAALSDADFVVHPSGYEGNSLFVLETLACGVPIVGYDVGLLYQIQKEGRGRAVGELLPRRERSPEATLGGVSRLLERIRRKDQSLDSRGVALDFSLERFKSEWVSFVDDIERSAK